MRKLLFLFFAVVFWGCSNNDDLPCVACGNQSQGSYYCLTYNDSNYQCRYVNGGCSGQNYGNDNTCGGYLWNNKSSSSMPSSSSSAEYIGGSCNVADYGTVNIGGQVWMKKNWGCYVSSSKCYNNDPANCEKYGRLYDWSTAMGISSSYNNSSYNPSANTKYRGVCPSGWHLPSDSEWPSLMSYVERDKGCSSCTGRHLKATSGWNSNGNGQDSYGFSALPGGDGYSDGSFGNVGNIGSWWSSSEYDASDVWYRYMHYEVEYALYRHGVKSSLKSVRCLQD